MDYTVYLYTIFVFLLVLVVIWLVARVVRFRKKSAAPTANEKEGLFKLYQSLEEMMNSLEEYVEKAREDMAKDKAETATMLGKMEQLYREMKEPLQAPAPTAEAREPVLAGVSRTRETAAVIKTAPQPREYSKPTAAAPAMEPVLRSALSAVPAAEPMMAEGALKKNKIVRFMRDEGLSDEQIAKELGISRGEVALILGMKEN